MFLCLSKHKNINIKTHKYIISGFNLNEVITMVETKLHMSIDEELKTQLKIIAAKQHKTMSEIVTELIKKYVDENK